MNASSPLFRPVGFTIETAIRGWVRAAGRSVRAGDQAWLEGPVGGPDAIGADYYRELAQRLDLDYCADPPDAGLMPSFEELRGPTFDPAQVDSRIADFYERTMRYDLDAWCQWSSMAQPFGCLLVSTVSRRIQQLNLPVFPLDTSRGMSSRIIQLRDRLTGTARYTGWLRQVSETGDVLYAGFYSLVTPPRASGPCIKTVFPLPNGSATVILRPEALPDGSFRLISNGSGFGDAGFYRVLQVGPDRWRVRYIRAMKEAIHVYVDPQGTLRTDHRFRFFRLPVLHLHYKIRRGVSPSSPAS